MPNIQLFVNTQTGKLQAGLSSSQTVDPRSLPFNYGDTVNLAVYLLGLPASYNPTNQLQSALANIAPSSLKLSFFLDDGTVGGTIYAQQTTFTVDPTNSFFSATLALNTAALQAVVLPKARANVWMHISYVDSNANQTTVFSDQVTVGIGAPSAVAPLPPGLTPLSNEVAKQTYWSINPIAGRPLYLESPNGHTFALTIIDNADGTASFQASQLN